MDSSPGSYPVQPWFYVHLFRQHWRRLVEENYKDCSNFLEMSQICHSRQVKVLSVVGCWLFSAGFSLLHPAPRTRLWWTVAVTLVFFCASGITLFCKYSIEHTINSVIFANIGVIVCLKLVNIIISKTVLIFSLFSQLLSAHPLAN